MEISRRKKEEIGDSVVEWIMTNLNLEDLFEDTEILGYVRITYNPEDVFSTTELSDWAFENGYRKFE